MPINYPAAQATVTGLLNQEYSRKGSNHTLQAQFLSVTSNSLTLTSGTLYAVYIGQLNQNQAFTKAAFSISSAGSGTQTAELALFSSPSAPKRAGQTLTCLVSSSVNALTSTINPINNTTTFSGTTVNSGTHLWVGFRTAMTTTQPAVTVGYGGDWGTGQILTLAASGVLTATNTYAATVPTAVIQTTTQAPKFLLTID